MPRPFMNWLTPTPDIRRRVPVALTAGATVAAMLLLSGCQSTPATGPDARTSLNSRTRPAGRPANTPAGITRADRVAAAVYPKGPVPYDGMSLPLVHPDSTRLVTQTGAPPRWSTIIAERDAPVPHATRLAIYRVPRTDDPPARQTVLDEPALLGRSVTDAGFLIESPREDGSRWIGIASWNTGEISWLVQTHATNAFACLGPDNRLAWSRRGLAYADDRFQLVVRQGDHEFIVADDDTDWLMPFWSGVGDGLFALALRDGELELVFGTASSAEAFRQSARRLPLATGATIHTAYNVLNGPVTNLDLPAPRQHRIVFVNPVTARAMMWSPRSIGRDMQTFREHSFAAVPAVHDDVMLVSTYEAMLVQSIDNPSEQAEVFEGAVAVRRAAVAEWPYVILAPGERAVAVSFMRLLPKS